MTQPAVSIAIKNLESYYNMKLLNKCDNQFELTPAGETLYKYALKVVSDMQTLEQEMKKCLNHNKDFIQLGIPIYICDYLLSNILLNFNNLLSEIKINITQLQMEHLKEYLLNGKIQIALSCQKFEDPKIKFIHFITVPLIFVTNPNNHNLLDTCLDIKDIWKEKFILWGETSGCMEPFNRWLKSKGLTIDEIPNKIIVEHIDTIKKLVEKGAGISLMAKTWVCDELKRKVICAVPIKGNSIEINYYIAYLLKHKYPQKINIFLNYLRNYALQHPININ